MNLRNKDFQQKKISLLLSFFWKYHFDVQAESPGKFVIKMFFKCIFRCAIKSVWEVRSLSFNVFFKKMIVVGNVYKMRSSLLNYIDQSKGRNHLFSVFI